MRKKIYLFVLLLFAMGTIYAQTGFTGIVVDEIGNPVIGASILVKGTTHGTVTDVDGNFFLTAPDDAILVISYVGMHTREVPVSPNMRIVLESDTELLDEIVVVGYGTQRRENLTGAVSTVDVGKTLEARPYSDVGKALQGTVPGLSVISNSGVLGAQPSITIRGLGTLSNKATSNPLLVVDGVPMDDLSLLNTQDIENISVLKDAASTSDRKSVV